MTKTILVVQKLYQEQIEQLKEKAVDYEVVESLEGVDEDSVEIILGWSDELLPLLENKQSNVKWIQFPYAGVNALPLKLFAEKNILLTNGSGIHAHSVTETTMGLILAMTRLLVEAVLNQRKKRWKDQWENDKEVYELVGKTMLIVGAGKIGVQLAKVAKAFNMRTIGINRSGRKIENMDEQYTQKELAEVIHKGDIVVNILPLTEETFHLFDEDMFSKMKDGVIFINVGRGASVVTADLLKALDTGKVSRAGLDVFEEEPLPANHPLWEHDKVLITPHIAGQVESYSKYLFPIFMKNFEAFIEGRELPENLVKLDKGY